MKKNIPSIKLTKKELEEEKWKDVVGYEGIYEVSNMGRIRRHDEHPFVTKNGNKIQFKKRFLTPLQSHKKDKKRSGYRHVCFTKGKYCRLQGKRFSKYRWHRVVAQAWIPNPLNKLEVNHKNGIKYDNRVCNLEWVTSEENMQHAIDTGLLKTH